MRIFINAASARTGGAQTYLRSVIPELRRAMAREGEGSIVVWAPKDAHTEADGDGVQYREPPFGTATGVSALRRLWFDQWTLPRALRAERADAVFSSANFGTLGSPVRQVLLVRNSLYFDPVALGRIPSRSVRARYFAQRTLTLRSIEAADVVLFPTRAMLDLVAPHVYGATAQWRVAPYGVRHDLFSAESGARPIGSSALLLNVSLYCDQKNLGTLFRALQALDVRAPGRYRLRITAGMDFVEPGPWHPNLDTERTAFHRLAERGVVEDVSPQRHVCLPELYGAADVFVFPSYSESFGHPLVEAMSCGLPIVAADVAVNREMCRDAAIYFEPFDVNACADAIARIVEDSTLSCRLREAGLRRARDFTWQGHGAVLWSAMTGGGL